MNNDKGLNPVALHQFCGLGRPVKDGLHRQSKHEWFVDETIDGHNVFVPVLREEFGDLVVELKRAFPIEIAVCSVEPVDRTLTAAMVPSVLAAGDPMRIKVHPQPIFSTVFNRPQKIPP